jgi:cell division protein FtsW (lipid II flippase)
MLATWAFLIFALAVGDKGYTKKARVASNKRRHNTRQLVFVIVGIIIMKIVVMACSCDDKTQPVTQSVCTRPT